MSRASESSGLEPFPARRFIGPKHWLTWAGLGVMWAIARLPVGFQFRLGTFIGELALHLARHRRHVTEVNIGLCFAELGKDEQRAFVRRIFHSTGISAVETAAAWFRDPEDFRARLVVRGAEHLRRAQSLGRGVVLAGAHFATLDMAGALLSLIQDIDVMYRPNRNALFELVMRRGRKRLYDGVIDRSDTRTVLRRLRAGRTVWYGADQDYGKRHSVFAPFFDIPAATVTATARLAAFNNSPVVFVSHFRDTRKRTWSLEFTPLPEAYPSGDELADATCLNRIIEAQIRRHPEQYLWLHRRFKTRPDGEQRPYQRFE